MSLGFLTTCKGRLEQIKRTLHSYADYPTVLVDYDCPEKVGQWVSASFPAVQVVEIKDAPNWNASLCRNIGMSTVPTTWVMSIDADVKVESSMLAAFSASLEPGFFYLSRGRLGYLMGTVCVRKEDFDAIGGYDEVIDSYGGEDSDLYRRLMLLGLKPKRMPAGFLEHLFHPDHLRTCFQADVDTNFTGGINRIYSDLKVDILRLARQTQLPLAYRRTLYAQVKAAVASLETAPTGFISAVFENHSYGALTRKLTMQFEIKRDPAFDELVFPKNDFELYVD